MKKKRFFWFISGQPVQKYYFLTRNVFLSQMNNTNKEGGSSRTLRRKWPSIVGNFEYESDLRSNEHYLSSSENKVSKMVQACTGFEPMTSAISVQCSTNWAYK